MCKITNKLILCSCDTDLDFHDNHWALNRFRNGKEEIMIGQPMMPYDLDQETESYNISFLANLINQGDCFDFEAEFQEKDQLVLFLKNEKGFQEDKIYAFEFSGQKWSTVESEPLMLNWYHNTIRQGFILSL